MFDENEDNQDQLNLELPEVKEEEDPNNVDFPEYANEQNKQLNQIIKEKRKLNKEISSKLQDRIQRTKILKEHLKNVQQELLHTYNIFVRRQLIESKNKEIETEDHLKQVAERQVGRIESEMRKLEKLSIEQQEALNDQQNLIFKGYEKLDKFKLQMNWNQEELEQWALAARQKEEDNLIMEKYKRADEAKIKDLNLLIEKLTIEVSECQNLLNTEITETQAKQIELDKNAEEFKKHHEERHTLFLQWQEVTENISRRDQAIVDEGEQFAQVKLQINQIQQELEEKKQFLVKQKQDNKNIEFQITLNERKIIEEKAQNKRNADQIQNLEAEVEILKNQLSAFASELAGKRATVQGYQQELLNKKQRLTIAQQKYNNKTIRLKNEAQITESVKDQQKISEEKYKENDKQRQLLEKEIRLQKDVLFKNTQELFKLREKEADLYGEIQSTMAASRNLQSHIGKLNQEFQRQQELLYNAEYQIQLMERKVARARGEKTLEEKKDLEKEIKLLEEEFQAASENHKLLSQSLKKLEEDFRTVEKLQHHVKLQKDKYQDVIETLILENDMTYVDMQRITKQKEEVLVRHDCMKLEIQKINKILQQAIDKVYDLQNRKDQLEMSQQEREKEIQVHRDVLLAENKAAENERHKIAVELSERTTMVKNLRIKYESLVQKSKAGTDDGLQGEHSQAYYVIKASQEREELQRKGDDLNAKILKSEKELQALDNTHSHLRNRNSNYRDSFLNKGGGQNDIEYKNALEEQCKVQSKNFFKKQQELTSIQKEFDEDLKRLSESRGKADYVENTLKGSFQEYQGYLKDIKEQEDKFKRAEKNEIQKLKTLKQKTQIDQNNIHLVQANYDIEYNKNKILQQILNNLIQDFPEIGNIIEDQLRQNGAPLASRPPSSIDKFSERSQRL